MSRTILLLASVVSLATPCLGEGGARAEAVTVEELVRDLGDERFPVRVRASHELWTRGKEAAAALQAVAGSDSPEVAIRAAEVLRKIELGILPDSPPQVVRLVMQYDRASADERVGIVGELKKLRAWRQLLKIHELERDPETLVKIAPDNPFFPRLWSSHELSQRPSSQKQIPSNQIPSNQIPSNQIPSNKSLARRS